MEDKEIAIMKNAKEELGFIGKGSLHSAVYENNLRAVKNLIENGGDLEAVDENGGTPLHLAAELKRRLIVYYLVENGADVNARDNFRKTPLVEACFSRDLALVKYLIDNGADASPYIKKLITKHKALIF